ncbi:hypothetical protein IFM61392_07309 [Aspergillus lentulus]|uniref:Zn(2)-C6 fungal-type domain-containing protein n=1 Tax=Aspergillus lentulus TaxID=293939 RepID=A0AAN5YPK5_ASPLE|nr:hypothetical protein CNMCM6069_006157 [Aspergillus lentulus]KAF4185927.1 hypothetical protein CNMCM7927_006105 [Aspergillus lentulus]KAF4205571.1 hypothetical protein CNMCM8927_006071 [Aspergillus lentulus]GFF73334.1 hypothetical protein IFM60648_03915 [Aspergillus lentulus]GFF93971.1 hypothetical protein IFM47457_09719 [Aspergillus lentulus]
MNGPFIPTKNPSQPKGSGPSLLACLLCRHKHLKCDGVTPVCGRCAATGAECQYTPSRRGYKGPSKKRRANPSSPERTPSSDQSSSFDFQSVALLDASQDWSVPDGLSYIFPNGFASSDSNNPILNNDKALVSDSAPVSNGCPLTPDSVNSVAGDGYLIDIYYTYFHPSHPILPPLRILYRSHVPPFLEHVIKFIGSHFTPAANSEVYRPSVMSSAMEQESSVEKLQALLLLAVVLHSRNERAEAGQCLATAVDLAFELGLHRQDFAISMGGGDPIREESLRRTWWELFIVEGMLTALGVQRTFRTSLVPLEVGLPCEERIFQDGMAAPPPPTIAQFDDHIFADEERDFSSYTYRIEAVRILGRVVAIQDMLEGQEDHVEAVDARINSFFHHLPESKAELMRPDGSVDEMMFQAKMIANGASVYLNFPRSDLLSSPAVAAEVICGHHGPCSIPAFTHNDHAMKALKAAKDISQLASIRLPVVKHTPFFICALVLSSIVQLASCSVKAGRMPEPSRERLSLTIGVFKTLARTWAISQAIMRQVKAVARDVLDVGLRPAAEPLQVDLTTVLDGGRFWLPEALPS